MRFSIMLARYLLAAGLVAGTALASVTPTELAERLARNDGVLVIDVRPTSVYSRGHIPGAISVPLSALPHKRLPTAQPVIIYGDGLGWVDESQALKALADRPGLNATVLEGGYANWLAQTRLTTAEGGVKPESLPGITYDRLLAADKTGMVLMDLRGTSSSAAKTETDRTVSALSVKTDVLATFAQKLGVPVVASNQAGAAAAPSTNARALSTASAADSDQLLVLVAEDEAAATDAARQLRASGQYRFTILIGGMEAIRREGRVGSARRDGRGSTVQ